MFKLAIVFGTRPDAIKLAPVIKAFQRYSDEFRIFSIATGQHRLMLKQVLNIFKIEPDYNLKIMTRMQSLDQIIARGLEPLGKIFSKLKPDLVMVQGDTTTTFLASLVAYYHKIRVGHVEAGLRTYDRYNPFPEEINRRLTSILANYHFAPTLTAKKALIAENVPSKHIYITGNTVIDTLKWTVREDYIFQSKILREIASQVRKGKLRVILITAHRRENWGEPMRAICRAVRHLSEFHRDKGIRFVLPVHLNPQVNKIVYRELKNVPGIYLTRPLKYSDFVNLMNLCYFVMTDSGGVQEEAPSLGKPVLVMRHLTERPEAVKAGTVRIVGLDEERIFKTANLLLNDIKEYQRMAYAVNPYGDGKASERIVEAIRYEFGLRSKRPREFHGSDPFTE